MDEASILEEMRVMHEKLDILMATRKVEPGNGSDRITAAWLRAARRRLNLNQGQFARRMNMTQSQVCKAEGGHRAISSDTMLMVLTVAGFLPERPGK